MSAAAGLRRSPSTLARAWRPALDPDRAALAWVALLLLLPLSASSGPSSRAGSSSVAHTLTQPDVLHAFLLTAHHHRHHGGRDGRLRRHRGVGARAAAVPRPVAAERHRRPPVRAVARHGRARGGDPVRPRRVVRSRSSQRAGSRSSSRCRRWCWSRSSSASRSRSARSCRCSRRSAWTRRTPPARSAPRSGRPSSGSRCRTSAGRSPTGSRSPPRARSARSAPC